MGSVEIPYYPWLHDLICNWEVIIVGGIIYDFIMAVFGDSMSDTLSKWMESVFSVISDILNGNMVNVIFDAFAAIACSLLILYFFQDLMNQASKDMFSFEKLVVMFIRMFIAFCVLLYTKDILDIIVKWATGFKDISFSISGEFRDDVFRDFGLDRYTRSDFEEEFKGLRNILRAMSAWGSLLLPYAISFFAELMGKFVITSSGVMLVVRMIFSPIAVVQVFEEGSRSSGIRYIKGMLADAMSFGVILIIIRIGNSFSAGLVNSALGGTFSLAPATLNQNLGLETFIPVIIPKLVIVGGMASASKIAHDVMGA